jgi:hypothetical protein
VIKAGHLLIYSADAAADREFLRDVLGLADHVDAGDGWLIFKLPPSEIGVHPAEPGEQRHEFSLVCDDIEATVTELSGKGVDFTGPVVDAGYGLMTMLRLPGGGEIQLYQAKHPTAYGL